MTSNQRAILEAELAARERIKKLNCLLELKKCEAASAEDTLDAVRRYVAAEVADVNAQLAALPEEPQAEPITEDVYEPLTEPRTLVNLDLFDPIGEWCQNWTWQWVTDGSSCAKAQWQSTFWTSDGCDKLGFTPTHARPVEVTP